VDKGAKIQTKIGATRAKSALLNVIILGIVSFGVYSLIALRGIAELFGLDALLRYMGAFLQLVQAFFNIGKQLGAMSEVRRRLRIYFEILESPEQKNGMEKLDDIECIQFKNVRFRYSETSYFVLDDISMTIKAGHRIAIVGENGSGKTTFVKILCGLYAPTDGQILINNRNIHDYTSESLTNAFSTVFQDFSLFSLSLNDNISCGQSIIEENFRKLLDKVGFSDTLKKSTYDISTYLYHDCNQNGIEISGGEAQKLALARALYKNAPIMILDEPTAALDPFAEQELYHKFDTLVQGKTVFYISHRLSSCYFCDKVAVFDHGKLVQFGTHQELIADELGKYHELWMTQAQYYV
jgi:ATP-binding cassette subfamily B protein